MRSVFSLISKSPVVEAAVVVSVPKLDRYINRRAICQHKVDFLGVIFNFDLVMILL